MLTIDLLHRDVTSDENMELSRQLQAKIFYQRPHLDMLQHLLKEFEPYKHSKQVRLQDATKTGRKKSLHQTMSDVLALLLLT